MFADPHFARLVHEDRRARLEGAARSFRLLRSLRRAAPSQAPAVPAPARIVGPAAVAPTPARPALVRPAPTAPGRTPGAAGRAA